MHLRESPAGGLNRRPLVHLHGLVLAIAVVALLVFATGMPALFRRSLLAAPAYNSTLPAPVVALFFIIPVVISLPIFSLIAALLIWRRPRDTMALLAALMLLLTGVLYNGAALESPAPVWLVAGVLAMAETSQLAFLWLFPSGSFLPRYTRRLVVPLFIWRLLMWALLYLPRYRALPLDAVAPGAVPLAPLDVLLVIGCFAHGALSQVVRYRSISTHQQRQQTKWLLFGVLIVVVVVGAVILFVNGLGSLRPATNRNLGTLVATSLLTKLVLLTVPTAIMVAILRHHLFDIDRVINRTLVYTILTGMLLAVYGVSVVLMQQVVVLAGGEADTSLAVVSSTLASAALFQPLRVRVQRGIDRRFYRQKYDLTQTLATFSATLRDEVDLELLTQRLLAVVDDTMHPAHLSLWLRDRAGRAPDPARPSSFPR